MPFRDFIPADEDLNDEEKEAQANYRNLYQDGVYQDFIPAPETELRAAETAEEGAARAMANAIKAADNAWEEELANASAKMRSLTVSQAHDFLATLPLGPLEMHLLAEERGGNRKSILSAFPKVSDDVRKR